MPQLPSTWIFGASSFNWTREIIRARRGAAEIVTDIAANGVTRSIELEAGQVLRGFPSPSAAECHALREDLATAGGRISVLGISLDDYHPGGARRSLAARAAFIHPQLIAARELGADGVRLPLGQAGAELLRRILPDLEELNLVLHEEIHGSQNPTEPGLAAALGDLHEIDPTRLRIALDTSMLMPAVPPTYVDSIARLGAPASLLKALSEEWPDPAVRLSLRTLLTEKISPPLRSLLMSALIRFGNTDVSSLRELLPMVASVHLKFWDLEEVEAVSAPLRALAPELVAAGFKGTLSSEWGGHDWLDADASEVTRTHLALVTRAMVI